MSLELFLGVNDTPIEGLPIGRRWFEHLMQRAFKTDTKIANVQGKRVDEGKGLSSIIVSLRIEWATADPKLQTRVVVKIPTAQKFETAVNSMQEHGEVKVRSFQEMQDAMASNGEQFDLLEWAHRNECMAYELMCGDGREPPVRMASYYYSEIRQVNNPAVLIIEDLSDRGKTPNLGTGLNYSQLQALMKELAVLHAYGLKNPNWNSDGRFGGFTKGQLKSYLDQGRSSVNILRQLPEARDIFTIKDEDLDRICNPDEIIDFVIDSTNKQYHPVIVHGDFWMNNFLYGKDRTDELVALLDWQCIHQGNPTEDFGRVLATSVNHELRRAKEFELIEEYYETLKGLLSGTGVQIPYTVEELKLYYRMTLRFGATISLMVGMIIADPKAAKGYTEQQRAAIVWRVQFLFEDLIKEF